MKIITDGQVVDELIGTLNAALGDPAIAHVTIEGDGGRFSAGADIADFDRADEGVERTRRLLQLIEQAPKPVFALIDGLPLIGAWLAHAAGAPASLAAREF